MQALLYTLLVGFLVSVWNIRKLWDEVKLLKAMERRTQDSQSNFRKEFNDFLLSYRQEREVFLERIRDADEAICDFRTAYDMFGRNYEEDRKAIGECIGKMQESLDEVKDSAMERNIQEAKMFEGISNMMNYDHYQALKAVRDDA